MWNLRANLKLFIWKICKVIEKKCFLVFNSFKFAQKIKLVDLKTKNIWKTPFLSKKS